MFIVDEKLEKFKIANLLINNGNDTQISKFLFAVNLENHWKKIVGEYICEKTQISYKEEGILKVYSEYSTIKTEIFLRKENLITQINDLVQSDVIKNIEVI